MNILPDQENVYKLIDLLGRENAIHLLSVYKTLDTLFPLLCRFSEYVTAVSEEVTRVLNRQTAVYPQFQNSVCMVEYIADQEQKGGLLFRLLDTSGEVKIWIGDAKYSSLLDEDNADGELVVVTEGELPAGTGFFLWKLSVAQAQLVQQLSSVAEGTGEMLISPVSKN